MLLSTEYLEKLGTKRDLLERIGNLTGLLEKQLSEEDTDSFTRSLKLRQLCIDSLEPGIPYAGDESGTAREIRERLESLAERSESLSRAALSKKEELAKKLRKVKTAQKTVTVYDGIGQNIPPRYFDLKK